MIAHIIPIKRMPRTLGLLTYTVPSELTQRIAPGQLIRIPLRKSTVYGLVFSIEDKTEQSHEDFKEIESIIHDVPIFTPNHLSLICFVADTYGISYGSAALLFAPPLQKRKLSQEAWEPIGNQETTLSTIPIPHITLLTPSDDLSSELSRISEATLIIVPEIADIDVITASLRADTSHTTWHSTLSTKEKFERWFEVRSGAANIVVGTRTALFLPFPHLKHIYIYKEESASHKHWDQKPQYLVHDLIPAWTDTYRCAATYLTYSPRFETYYHAAKGNYSVDSSFFTALHAPLTRFQVINMSHERKAGNYDILAESVLRDIQTTQGDICLYINRKGYATAVGCTNCAYISRCERCHMTHSYYDSSHTLRCHYCGTSERIPATCKDCSLATLTPYGVGTEQVESYIKSACATMPHDIVRIDSSITDIPKKNTTTPTIYIGTDMLFSHLDWQSIKLFVCVQIDDLLLYPDYRATESVWHTLRHITHYLPSTSTAYIQTYQTEHILLRSLNEPERLYRSDLRARQAVQMPPYTKLVRLSIGKPTLFTAETEAQRVYHMIGRILTEQGISGMVSYPFTTSPTFYRGQYWVTILIKLSPDAWQKDTQTILSHIPSQWRVDISPQSLLSP